LIEHRNNEIREESWEVLAAAEIFSSKFYLDISAVILGYNCDSLIDEAAKSVSCIHYLESEELKHYSGDRYSYALEMLVKKLKPKIILLPHTIQGMEIGAYLAGGLDVPYLPDCLDLVFEKGAWQGTRELFGGKIKGEFLCSASDITVISLRPGVFRYSVGQDKESKVYKESIALKADEFLTQFVKLIQPETGEVDITKSDILVGVGRGLGDKEKVEMCQHFADALGGTLAASRPVVDMGWINRERQVGQSGKKVKPKLYIACGISGASQHIIGMKGSKTIVGINSDPNAPIFNIADFGIVGDLCEIIPSMTEALKAKTWN
jgi:electron transfer flavoprotein alpha subunit